MLLKPNSTFVRRLICSLSNLAGCLSRDRASRSPMDTYRAERGVDDETFFWVFDQIVSLSFGVDGDIQSLDQ